MFEIALYQNEWVRTVPHLFENILLLPLPVPVGGDLDTVTPRRKSGLSGDYCGKSKVFFLFWCYSIRMFMATGEQLGLAR